MPSREMSTGRTRRRSSPRSRSGLRGWRRAALGCGPARRLVGLVFARFQRKPIIALPPAQKAEVRYDERNDEVESAVHPRHRCRIACEDDVELVDRRKDDADDERDARCGTWPAARSKRAPPVSARACRGEGALANRTGLEIHELHTPVRLELNAPPVTNRRQRVKVAIGAGIAASFAGEPRRHA